MISIIGKHIYINGKYYGIIVDTSNNLIFFKKEDEVIPNAIPKQKLEKLKVEILESKKGD